MLQYVAMTRPDIEFAVHVVFKFIHAPPSSHLSAVKCIFSYPQGTLSDGLHIRPTTSLSLIVAYSDVDWAGCNGSC